ncbi:MAG: HAD family hydrolase [Phycisphaerales bacterium]
MPRVSTRYDLIAIDLDGTLLGPDGQVSEGNRRALVAAREAGVTVVPCTGRGLVESRRILAQFDHEGPVITAGGAITCDARTGETLHRFPMDPELAGRAVTIMHEAGHAALVLKDAPAAGFEYLVLGSDRGHRIDPIIEWWFQAMRVTARFGATLADDEHPEHSVRVGLCAEADRSAPVAERLRVELGDRVVLHDFPAVVHRGEHRTVHILEVFDASASKWAAIEAFCARAGLDPARTAAIGDEINDVPMIRGAGLGVAMGNAIDPVKHAADRHAPSNADDGVAFAIGRILDGAW